MIQPIMYLAFCQDRHIDAEIRLFEDLGKAIFWAAAYMRRQVAYPDQLKVVLPLPGNTEEVWRMEYPPTEEDFAWIRLIGFSDHEVIEANV